jgi:hypothetical protein
MSARDDVRAENPVAPEAVVPRGDPFAAVHAAR